MASTVLTQIEELADSLASIQKKHHLTEASVIKIAEMVFSNYWSGRQLDLQATQAGLYQQPDEPDERINGLSHTVDDENGEA